MLARRPSASHADRHRVRRLLPFFFFFFLFFLWCGRGRPRLRLVLDISVEIAHLGVANSQSDFAITAAASSYVLTVGLLPLDGVPDGAFEARVRIDPFTQEVW